MNADNNFTPLQAKKAGFDRNEYAPATEALCADEGIFTGTLIMKVYGDFCLRCYFLTDNGRKLKLTAWQNRRTGRYGPRGCGVDFKEMPTGTRWENRVEQSRTGKLSWIDAKKLT